MNNVYEMLINLFEETGLDTEEGSYAEAEAYSLAKGIAFVKEYLTYISERMFFTMNGKEESVEKYADMLRLDYTKTDRETLENAIKANIPDKEAMKDNIRNALTIYYKMYGLAFFDLQEMSDQASQEKAIQAAMYNLDKRLGTSLVREIAYTIKNPSEREALILEQWARAFVTMQIIGLDPSLKNFQATRIREKEFILDTDLSSLNSPSLFSTHQAISLIISSAYFLCATCLTLG